MTSWYNSAMNYDMISTNPWNSMNLHMNQMWDHSFALQNLYAVPRYDFGNFYQYCGANLNMTNPAFTIGQMAWGTPSWGHVSGMFGLGGNTNATSNNNNTNNDPEQEAFRIKYNKLYNLVNQLKTYDELTSDEISTLKAACKNAKGTWEEKYTKLKEAYDTVKETASEQIKNFIIETEKVKISTDENGKAKSSSDSFHKALIEAGFEFEIETDADDAVKDFYDSIAELKGKDGSALGAADAVGSIEIGSIDILDFISSWNTKYKDKDGSKRIFEHIETHIGTITDEDLQETSYSQIIKPLTDALIKKSESFNRRNIDAASYKKLEEARKDLQEEIENSKNTISDGLSEAFDRLYVLTRKAAMAEFRYNVIQSYGDVDEDLFNEKLFVDEVDKDLIDEGLDLTDSNMNIKRRRNSKKTSDNSDRNNDNKSSDGAGSSDSSSSSRTEDTTTKQNEKDKAKSEEISNAGYTIATGLGGVTRSYVYTEINSALGKLNKKNIMSFLDSYYVDGKRAGKTEGLIEKLDDEYDGGTITMANKTKIVNSLLSLAEEKGLKDSVHYKELKRLITAYQKDTKLSTKKTFNQGGWARLVNGEFIGSTLGTAAGGAAAGAATCAAGASWAAGSLAAGPIGWAAAIGGVLWGLFDKVTDNEVIDKHLEALYNEIKALG